MAIPPTPLGSSAVTVKVSIIPCGPLVGVMERAIIQGPSSSFGGGGVVGGEEVAVLPALPSVDDVFWPPLVNVAVLPLPPLEVVVDVVVVEVAVVVVTVVIIEEAVSCSFVVITPSVVTNSFNLL